MGKWQLNGVAYEDLGWDLDEMSDLDGFLDWLVDENSGDAVWNAEEGYWEYPEDEWDDEDWDDEEDFDEDEFEDDWE